MTYATLDEVRGLMAQFTIDATSTPTATEATAILDETSDEIDMRLSAAGVAIPATAPAGFLNFLGRLNAYGTAAAILKSMFPGATGAAETPAYAFWEKRYRDGLKAIVDGSAIPPDAATGSGTVNPSTYFTRNPDAEEDLGDIAEPRFKMNKVF